MNRVIGVFSSKGGVGKTTCALNIAMSLHDMGTDVALIDCDLKNSNLSLHLGLYDFPLTVQDVLEGDVNYLDAIYIHSSGLRILPASITLREFKTEISKLRNTLDNMNHHVVLDTPPGASEEASSVIQLCDEIMVLTTPNIPSITDTMKTIQMAKDVGKKIRGVIINRAEKKHEIKKQDIEKVLGLPVLAVIPEDRNVRKSLHANTPVVRFKPHSPSSIALKRLSAGIIQREYSPPRFLKLRRLFR